MRAAWRRWCGQGFKSAVARLDFASWTAVASGKLTGKGRLRSPQGVLGDHQILREGLYMFDQ
jgi:hypothetical protein